MQFGLFRPPPATRALMIAMTVIPLLQWGLAQGMHVNSLGWTVMDAGAVLHGQVWRVLTYLFTYGLGLSWLFDILMLWLFGSGFEASLGRQRFLKLFFGTGLAGGLSLLLAGVLNVPAITGAGMWAGADASLLGLATAFSIMNAQETVTILLFLVLPVKVQGMYFAPVIALLMWGMAGTPPVLILTSMLVAWLMVAKGYWGEGKRFGGKSKKKPKSRLQFVPPSGQKVTPIRPEFTVPRSDDEVDRILDKLRKEGMAALSPQERATLDSHSQNLRQRDGL